MWFDENTDDFVYSISGGTASLSSSTTSGTWYNNAATRLEYVGIHPGWTPDPLAAYDSYLTVGSENSDGPEPFGLWFAGNNPSP